MDVRLLWHTYLSIAVCEDSHLHNVSLGKGFYEATLTPHVM